MKKRYLVAIAIVIVLLSVGLFVHFFTPHWVFAQGAEDENTVCGEVPLYLGRYVAPEILFIVDLSGSMGYGLRPDWSPVYNPNETYPGHYTDINRGNYVYNRQYYYDSGYFIVYPCFTSPDNINDSPLNSHCPGRANPSQVYIDEILKQYGIADWSDHQRLNTPPYASQSRPDLYENDAVALGNYLNTTRIEVVTQVIKTLIPDPTLAIGVGFFKQTFPSSQDYTRIYEGIEAYSEEHLQELKDAIDSIAHEPVSGCNGCYRVSVMQGTPFSPSIVAARKYFEGNKTDITGSRYSPGVCAKKFVIFLTDGIGNVDSTVGNVRSRTISLVNSGVTPIAVGFNLSSGEDEQLREMARMANEYADGHDTYALHRDVNNDGIADPFIARNPQELAEILRSIIYEIKQTVFTTGSGAARNTNLGNVVVYTSFDLTDWTGEVRTSNFAFGCANCHSPADVRTIALWNYFKDEDSDGKLDLINEDLDGDGRLDTKYEDINENGVLDQVEDLDGDGHLDVPEDLDGDGHLDSPEGIDYDALEAFLSNEDAVRDVMGEQALRNYSQSKIPTLLKILKGEFPDSKWWETENGWTTSDTLPCGISRNIKYQNEQSLADFVGSVGDLTEDQVDFIRGEVGCGSISNNGFRTRSRPLGDIISSNPRAFGNLIWVTANDGMLHAFDINTGEEEFAFIPQSVISKYLESGYFYPYYCHNYFFDGTPTVQKVNNEDLLVVGLGRGGSEYICLDITNAPSDVSFKWSFIDPELGEPWNESKLVRCGESNWRLFLASGYVDNPEQWATKKAVLISVDPNSGEEMGRIYMGNEGSNMPATPGSAVDLDGDLIADRLYVGDLIGRMWRISSPCSESGSAENVINLGNTHPITASGVAAAATEGVWLFFGTGKYWDIDDLTDTTSQYIIGARDSGTTLSLSDLTERVLTMSGEYKVFAGDDCSETTNGWRVTLTDGERVITPPLFFAGYVYFETFIPTGDECTGEGETWLYGLPARKGCLAENDAPMFDINNDALFDENDLIGGKPPVAVRIGKGLPSSGPIMRSENILTTVTTEGIDSRRVNTKPIRILKGTWTDVDVNF